MTRYPSNLNDGLWELIKDLLIKKRNSGYKRKYAEREMINAILYINKTGCQWRYLPGDFPPWKAVYNYFLRLSSKNTFERMFPAIFLALAGS